MRSASILRVLSVNSKTCVLLSKKCWYLREISRNYHCLIKTTVASKIVSNIFYFMTHNELCIQVISELSLKLRKSIHVLLKFVFILRTFLQILLQSNLPMSCHNLPSRQSQRRPTLAKIHLRRKYKK